MSTRIRTIAGNPEPPHDTGIVDQKALLARLIVRSWASVDPSAQAEGRVPESRLAETSRAVRAVRALHWAGRVPVNKLPASDRDWSDVAYSREGGRVPCKDRGG